MLLVLFALGTHMGIRAIVATGEHGESEAALRHVRRHFITVDNLRAAVTRLVNGTFAARDAAWWGQGTSCASDSKKFGSWSRNLMTEYHARYGGNIGDQGQVVIAPAPFNEQWTSEPAQVIALRPGERQPLSGGMAHGELHVAYEGRCTAPGAEDRQALAALRDALHRVHLAQARLTGVQAESDQVSSQSQDLLVEDLRGDPDQG
ncbi:transposase [Streptomyces sp. R1]|uniref:transposase n=1 Tax=Streptomyces sp. R1 TaxID=1509279 RepID=UPI001E6594BF|nr:transposase [Streptomyces sp. R1]MCC8337495.1 transposase [Streptomyces sp. R1]